MEMPRELEYYTADEVAECFDLSSILCGKLWGFLTDAKDPTPMGGDGSNGTVETPDGRLDSKNDDKAPHWWHKLTEKDQAEIIKAVGC